MGVPMAQRSARQVFLVGCERSGATWLANIFDAHPRAELWMEPCAPHARLLERPVAREIHAARVAGTGGALGEAFADLGRHKYPLAYRRGRSLLWSSLDRGATRAISRIARRIAGRTPLWVARYELLNLNQSEVPWAWRTRKRRGADVEVTKDVRLGLQVPLLARAFPQARFLVMVRHPVAQVASMYRSIEVGDLPELAALLPRFPDAVARQPRLRALRELVARVEERRDLATSLAFYWLVNYQTVLEDLSACGATHRVVRHEELSGEPEAVASGLLDWCGLGSDPAVLSYVSRSSRSEVVRPSPLDTARDSRSVALRALLRAPVVVRDSVVALLDEAVKTGLLHQELESYLDRR